MEQHNYSACHVANYVSFCSYFLLYWSKPRLIHHSWCWLVCFLVHITGNLWSVAIWYLKIGWQFHQRQVSVVITIVFYIPNNYTMYNGLDLISWSTKMFLLWRTLGCRKGHIYWMFMILSRDSKFLGAGKKKINY